MSELFTETILISMLAATIRIASPLIIAALGELISERGGVINLGVEGMMLMGCFVGFYVTYNTGSIATGIAAAILAGVLMSLIMAFLAVTLKLEQFVTGLALNLLASGLSLYWFRYFQGVVGTATPSIDIMEKVRIPVVGSIPWIGDIFFNQNMLTYFAFLMVPAIWFFLYRTKYGLELRCLGENPKALDVKGLNVTIRQYAAVLFGGAMAGLAGAFVSVGSSVRFVQDMTGGRGWLALVIVIAGNWMPKRILIAALIFAFLGSFQLHVQAIGVKFPYQVLLALPYVVAILLMMHGKAKSAGPRMAGVPYHRE